MNSTLTRIAPTPSGYLHLGNAFSFLLTKAIAQKTGAKTLLRIDDLDRERYRSEYVEDIFETLDFLEIPIDQGPQNLKEFEAEWSQVHRMNQYQAALDQLKNQQKLFACTCSRKKISQMNSSGYYLGHCLDRKIKLDRPEATWRINTLDADLIPLSTYSGQKKWEVIPEDVSFFIVRKKDGLPAYQLTSLIDDLHFGVDLIVRGQDLYSSSIAQSFLVDTLQEDGFESIRFFHHSILKGPGKQKLSKSEGATSLQYLRKEGKKLPEIYQMIGEMCGQPIHSFEDFTSLIP